MKEWLNRMKEDGTTGLEHGGTKLKHATTTTGVHSFDKVQSSADRSAHSFDIAQLPTVPEYDGSPVPTWPSVYSLELDRLGLVRWLLTTLL